MTVPKAARDQGQSWQQRQERGRRPIPDSSFSREASQAAKLPLTVAADQDLLRCSACIGIVQGLSKCLCDYRSCC